MLLLSSSFASLIEIFAPLFDSRVWSYAQLLLVGAVLAPGKRTVSSVLRIVGLGSEKHFQNYHRVLNRARWSGRAASQILLGLLLGAFSLGYHFKSGHTLSLQKRPTEVTQNNT